MEQIFLTAAVLLLPMLCTTAGAAGVFLLRKTGEPATRRMLCGMAAGIMLAASVWSLLLPAIERAEQGPLPAWVPPAVGLLLGAVSFFVCQCASSISACRVSSCSKLYSRFSASTSSFLESRGGRPSALSSWYFRSALPGVPESPQLYRSV